MLSPFPYDSLRFSQPEATQLVRATAATLDNWLRYEHADAARGADGRRYFSFRHLLQLDATEMLTATFRMPPKLASAFARRAAQDYERGFEADLLEIAAGSPWPAATRDLDSHFMFAREGEAVVEVAQGDSRPDSVMLVLPTRMIARRLLAAIGGNA